MGSYIPDECMFCALTTPRAGVRGGGPPSDSKEKNAFGAMVTQGIVFTTQFDIYTLASRRLYETGVRSFPRDGALRRSAYRVIVREVRQWHPNLA